MTRIALFVLALLLVPLSAEAQTPTSTTGTTSTSSTSSLNLASVSSAASTIAADLQTFVNDSKAGASATVLAADQIKLNADVDANAAALGITTESLTTGNYVLNLNIGGAGAATMAFPSKTGGVSIAGGGGGGLLIDLGIGKKTDASDHFHIAVTLGVTSLTYTQAATAEVAGSTTTVGAAFVSLTPAYQPSASAPEYGFGPLLACPFAGPQKSCIVGLTFTTALAGTVHQFLPGT